MTLMPDVPAVGQAALEVISPDSSSRSVPVGETPFFIGRGETGNHVQLPDRRISRQCAAILLEDGRYFLEDRGHRLGIFVNGKQIVKQALQDGDVVTLGLDNSYKIVFRSSSAESSIENLLTRIGSIAAIESSPAGLGKLNLLLEATMLLHSQLPLDAVLDAMLDRAIAITNADRGLLLEADPSGSLRHRLARSTGSVSMPTESFSPTQTALRLAVERQSGVITEDLHQADAAFQGAESIIAQRLRAVVAIPLYAMPRANSAESIVDRKSVV